MLTRAFTETIEMDGERLEVWVKPGRNGRASPKQERHVGTGFLVASDARHPFLVTAAHVASRMDGDACLSFARRGGRRRSIRLRDVLRPGSKHPTWASHGHADVAVLRLGRVPPGLRGHFLPARSLKIRAAPARELDLVVAGFPLGLFRESKFVALTMRAHAATDVFRLKGAGMEGPADFFLLDHPAMGGFSGGPVFVAPQVRVDEAGAVTVVEPRCAGLLSQTIADDQGARFSLVTPNAAIRRAIARAAA